MAGPSDVLTKLNQTECTHTGAKHPPLVLVTVRIEIPGICEASAIGVLKSLSIWRVGIGNQAPQQQLVLTTEGVRMKMGVPYALGKEISWFGGGVGYAGSLDDGNGSL
jgi:hypothetical protein